MIPFMDNAFKKQVRPLVEAYAGELVEVDKENPYGVRISTAGWAGNRNIVQACITNYLLHRSYPELINPEYIYRGLNYLYGCHPCHNLSFVSGVGAAQKGSLREQPGRLQFHPRRCGAGHQDIETGLPREQGGLSFSLERE